jgi:hypothetical protein
MAQPLLWLSLDAAPFGRRGSMKLKKILLVDDSRTSLFMEQMVLKNGPYEFVTARVGL